MKNITIKLEGITVNCLEKETLSNIILNNKIPLNMMCNEVGKCGKCKVKITNTYELATQKEKEILSEKEIKEGIRLACCTIVFDNMIVEEISKKINDKIKYVYSDEKINIINPNFKNYGMAIDIGTTTIVLKLYDGKNSIFSIASKNPQIDLGADVITRIDQSLKGNLNKLQTLVVSKINDMIDKSCKSIGINKEDIDYGVVTGNTTMLYLLRGLSPVSISKSPFISDTLFDVEINSSEINIDISKKGKIYLPKCISAFVGADITTAILASKMMKKDKNTLLIDIGTNGEVALWSNNRLYTCSTAAGPAFEGAELLNGMWAMAGAIDRVFLENGQVKCNVIDNVKAKGICGSGVIDLLSTLVDIGAIDETGYLESDILKQYGIIDESRDDVAVCIDEVLFTQKDVRKVQLVKSSIYSGILSILEINNVSIDDIDEFYIAGGFGNYIDLQKAINIDLIPNVFLEKTKVIGNAALDGCAMMLCNKDNIDYINNKVKDARNVDLATSKIFNNYYVENMGFNNVI